MTNKQKALDYAQENIVWLIETTPEMTKSEMIEFIMGIIKVSYQAGHNHANSERNKEELEKIKQGYYLNN